VRGRTEIERAIAVLEVARLHPQDSLSNICMRARLNFNHAQQTLFRTLTERRFVTCNNLGHSHHLKITEEGRDWLKRAKQVLADYGDKAQ